MLVSLRAWHVSASMRVSAGRTQHGLSLTGEHASTSARADNDPARMTNPLMRHGVDFWLALAMSCALTISLYCFAVWFLPKLGIVV